MKRRTQFAGWAAGLALGAMASRAGAQAGAPLSPEDRTRRRELIESAQHASETGDHVRALELAGRAGQMRMSLSLRRFVADEQTAAGQLARALVSARLCVQEEEQDPTAVNREEDLPACRALVASLQTRVGYVVVQAPAAMRADARVTVGGSEVARASWGAAVAVDPGHVVVELSAPGAATVRRDADVAAGASVQVPVAFAEPAGPVLVSREGRGTSASDGSTQWGIAWITLGGAGLALGGGLAAQGVYEAGVSGFNVRDAAHQCRAEGAVVMGTATCQSEFDQANTAQTVAVVGYIAGGALAATSVVLLLTAPRPAGESARTAGVFCGVGPGDVGVACHGAF